jgi:gamma-glutamylcyclotransferase (GGCT)/AIG2-like uncharacterized protein YtfP
MKNLYIFTYGTLKRGFVNNYFLDDAIFISTAITVEKYQMLYPSIGNAYPFLIKSEKKYQIKGEVFKTNSQQILDSLDELEGYPDLYLKEFIKVELENKKIIEALVYFKNEKNNLDAVDYSKPIIEWKN